MSSKDNVMMSGRGGAGNVKPKTEKQAPTVTDLATPHIKSDKYTTGRGGSGNMATNHPAAPDVARASQDVSHPNPTPQDRGHIGRGGEGNTWGTGEKKERTGSGTVAAKDKVKEKLKEGDSAGAAGAGGKKERKGSMGEQVAEKGMDMLRRLRSQEREKKENGGSS